MNYKNHLIILLLLALLSIGCSEADQNKNNLIGEWRLYQRTIIIGDNEIETTYSESDCLRNKGFVFNANSTATSIVIDTLCNQTRMDGEFSVTATALYISTLEKDEKGNQVRIISKYSINLLTSVLMELVYFDPISQISVIDEYHK